MKCFFGFHNWTKWTKIGNLVRRRTGRTQVLGEVTQKECKECGKTKNHEHWFV